MLQIEAIKTTVEYHDIIKTKSRVLIVQSTYSEVQ
jgi:hypothetical protein